MGENSGLRHVFVDSNNVVNGQTYYYAVVSYDHGDAELVVAPAECSKTITVNPETNEVLLDVNTIAIVPKAPTAGYVASSINDPGVEHIGGKGTGDVVVDIIDNTVLEDENSFQVIFSNEGNQLNYSLLDQKELSDTITVRMGQYSKLSHKNVDSTIFSVSSLSGYLYSEGIDFDLLDADGQIYVREGGSMTEGQTIVVSYRYFPIRNSVKLAAEEGNPIFDGMTITVQNDALELDNALISWNEYSPNNWTWWVKPFNNLPNNMHPADYELSLIHI